MITTENPINDNTSYQTINRVYRADETELVNALIQQAEYSEQTKQQIQQIARKLVTAIRDQQQEKSYLDSFLYQYDLSTKEGITLMCIAEALLRIPDTKTQEQLLKDKLNQGDWGKREDDSFFVNAATWGLMLSGKILSGAETSKNFLSSTLMKLVKRAGEPIVRKAINHAMKILGKQFVMGRTMAEALKRAEKKEAQGYRYSYDMLGEAAKTAADAERYFQAYQQSIQLAAQHSTAKNWLDKPGVSVKLSALHPRYEFSQQMHAIPAITKKLKHLALLAKQGNISLVVDAEETDRLILSLQIFAGVFADPELANWDGLGLAVQAYQKRAYDVIDWLVNLAKAHHKRIYVRLVKGAYWDSEIKWCQEKGLSNYPIFTRKINTDISYLACAQKLLANLNYIYPAFATHNAHTVASILTFTQEKNVFEFQCLHGMGTSLYEQIVGKNSAGITCRIYAPVGSHEDLLPYLVRRLLENGANSSFVNRIAHDDKSIAAIIADPFTLAKMRTSHQHKHIPLPKNIFPNRENSSGMDLADSAVVTKIIHNLQATAKLSFQAKPTFAKDRNERGYTIYNPANRRNQVGVVIEASEECLRHAVVEADQASYVWAQTPVQKRAELLEKVADLFEQHRSELMYLAIREAGKTIADSVAEIREAVDFCRYYANEAREKMAQPKSLPSVTGEHNELQLHGRGPILCISPWNFPLAIFTGQVTAALVAGNPVLAKPASQTPLIAAYAVKLMHDAGIPKEVVQLIPTSGKQAGNILLPDPRIKGVILTGSTETAWTINKTLAQRPTEIIPFIAETGGQNAMIVDSSALLEQVVNDVITSAFTSAGQRCSALRILFLQNDIADRFINLLKGAMAELSINDPGLISTDIGPVIDENARNMLIAHRDQLKQTEKLIFECDISQTNPQGVFFAPCAFEISNANILKREVFGPILHIVRYDAKKLDEVITAINATGYGLTLGIQTRIDEKARYIQQHIHAGNCYVNRNMIGAVVGVQPFGGEGLSGTGPKAGGPNYLMKLVHERTLTINTTAAGGNASLLCLEDE